MKEKPTRLGEMLLQAGLIDQFQLDSALSYQRNVGGRIGSAVVKLGYLSEETILGFLDNQSEFPRVDLRTVKVSRAVLSLIPAAKLYRCMAFPVELRKDGKGRALVVAMTDPTNLFLIDDLQFMAGCRVIPAVAPEDDILAALKRYFPGGKPLSVTKTAASGDSRLRRPPFPAGEDRLDRLIALLYAKGLLSRDDLDKLN